MKLKEQLRRLLAERDMTAAQLSRKSGISQSVISDWLSGASPRRIEQVKKAANVLGTSLDELCFGSGSVPKRPEGAPPGGKSDEKSDDILGAFIGDEWVGGMFEIRIRRIRR